MLVAVLQFASDEAKARKIVRRLMTACAPGIFLTISHPAGDIDAEQFGEATRRFNEAERMTLRDHAAVERLFSGLDLVPPAWSAWPNGARTQSCTRPAPEPRGPASPVSPDAGVGDRPFRQTESGTGRHSTRPIVDKVGDLAGILFLSAVAWLRTIAVGRS
jgi:S-adenosyl methyltransferase